MSTRQALEKLGPNHFLQFIRSLRWKSDTYAVECFNRELLAGRTVEQIFFDVPEHRQHLSEAWSELDEAWAEVAEANSGYFLNVEVLEPNRFRIDFSWSGGPLSGDGGRWEAHFDEAGRLTAASPVTYWNS